LKGKKINAWKTVPENTLMADLQPPRLGMWLIPVILSTQQAEMGKMEVQSQPGQKLLEISSQPITGHDGMCL
jgi:hypothetical protein